MPSTRSRYLDIYNAKSFKNSVADAESLYLTFGMCEPWANEASPDTACVSTTTFRDYWNSMIGGKRITGNDIRHAIRRNDWTTDTKYAQYEDTMDSLTMFDPNTKFVVVTDTFNVYKCISNNFGANSTSKPTSTLTTDVQTVDGYIWKYMYTLDAQEQQRFVTTGYIPVKTLALDDNSTQWQVQEAAIDGAIHRIQLTNSGSDYRTNNITVTITGDGVGCNAYAEVNLTSYLITDIVVDDKGYGYTHAEVSIESEIGGGASARAIISPPGGHGSDPLHELGGSYLVLNPSIQNSENEVLTINNDYRQVGILENPHLFDSDTISTNTVFSQLSVLTLNGISVNYQEDEWVYQGPSLADFTFKGRVVEWDSANSVMKISHVEGAPTNDLLFGDTSTASRFLSSMVNPYLERYTGQLLYLDNIQAIERASNQTESFQIVLKF